MSFLALVSVEAGRVSKFAAFDTAAEALAHADTYGGVVWEGDESLLSDLWIDGEVVTLAPQAGNVDAVKAEANRRILELAPEWKQRNLTAQAAILADKGRDNWTEEDGLAWAAGLALWGTIAAIRAASDRIEQMDPIPLDVSNDAYWSA